MDRALEALRVGEEETKAIEGLQVVPHRVGEDASFYEGFGLRGIHLDQVQPGFLSCSFTVPPRLTDVCGKMAAGAIAFLVDMVGAAASTSEGHQIMKVSVDLNIAFLSPAKVGDELEIRSRVIGSKGSYVGTNVLVRNKATGEVVAKGRHSLFGSVKSKI